jgi:hypothetical protein
LPGAARMYAMTVSRPRRSSVGVGICGASVEEGARRADRPSVAVTLRRERQVRASFESLSDPARPWSGH